MYGFVQSGRIGAKKGVIKKFGEFTHGVVIDKGVVHCG